MKILQIRRLSVNSISLDFSLWVKARQTFLNLFIGGNTVIVCSESSNDWSDVYFFVEDSKILLPWSIAPLLQYTFVETFTAHFKFIRGDVIATECLTTQTEYLRICKLFFEKARFSHFLLLLFYTTCSEEETCYNIGSEIIATNIWSHPLPFRFHFRFVTSFQLFLGELCYSTEFGAVVVVQLQPSQFCVLMNE